MKHRPDVPLTGPGDGGKKEKKNTPPRSAAPGQVAEPPPGLRCPAERETEEPSGHALVQEMLEVCVCDLTITGLSVIDCFCLHS